MFQNTYQNGNFFEIYDPKISQDKVKNVYKLTNIHGNNKVFDKELKTYVLQFTSPTAKMSLPREEKKDLYLIQQYLIFQIFFYPGMSWNIELVVSDLTKTKRRIMFSSATHKFEIKPFFVKYPCPAIIEGVWNNLAIDLFSFINPFKGQAYRSLDAIYLTGHFKLRRIYTTNLKPSQIGLEPEHDSEEQKQINFLPKNFYYPFSVSFSTKLISFNEELLEHMYEPTEPSTKNGSNLRSRLKVETPSTNLNKSQKTVGYKKQKKFLANTNGPEMMNRKKQSDIDSSQKSQYTEKNIKTPMSTDKHNKNKKSIGKPSKNRSNMEKKIKAEEKVKTKAKLNPWRSKAKDTQTDGGSQFSMSKVENERNVESAQTTLFKTKNNLVNKFNQSKNKGFDRKSDHYSDSEYIELSQKFSTLTDGKCLGISNKNIDHGSTHMNEGHENHDEIQENIEMQTNSVSSTAVKQINQNEFRQQLTNQLIEESICDSLDHFEKKTSAKMEKMALSSHYGFGEKMMNRFMGEIQRPYSPPLGQHEHASEISEKKEEKFPDYKQQVEVIYDPVLNCYYDHRTHTYYQLKN